MWRLLLHTSSGERYPVSFLSLQPYDIEKNMRGWDKSFNWTIYLGRHRIEVHKMVISGNDEIQGAIAIEDRFDHIYIHLVESAPHNRGKERMFFGVGPHLFSFACLVSRKRGYDGFVAFDGKTQLIEYYKASLGAQQLGYSRMIIDPIVADRLIQVYLS